MARDKTKRRMTLKAMLTEAPRLDGVCHDLAIGVGVHLGLDGHGGAQRGCHG